MTGEVGVSLVLTGVVCTGEVGVASVLLEVSFGGGGRTGVCFPPSSEVFFTRRGRGGRAGSPDPITGCFSVVCPSFSVFLPMSGDSATRFWITSPCFDLGVLVGELVSVSTPSSFIDSDLCTIFLSDLISCEPLARRLLERVGLPAVADSASLVGLSGGGKEGGCERGFGPSTPALGGLGGGG